MLALNFKPFPILKTDRLILRQIKKNDDNHLFKLRTDTEAMKFLGKKIPSTMAEIHHLIKRFEYGIANKTDLPWGICIANNAQLIGTIGFHNIEKEHYRAKIGYMLLPEFWNKGLMSEALKTTIEYGFKTVKFHTIQANIDPKNEKSAAILKKFNFIKEAYFKENYFFNAKFLDSEIYSLLNKED